jgi:hypothetical protein
MPLLVSQLNVPHDRSGSGEQRFETVAQAPLAGPPPK